MARPGIRHLNRGFNTVGRPTAPVNDRGSGVQEIPANLATQQQRTEILATGRKGETSNIRTAGLAAGTVLTQTAQNQFRSLTDAAYKSVVQQVPLVDIPSLDIPGINQPIIDNPVQFVGGFLQTSQYSPDLVQEARVRAEKGDIVSGLYAGTADTLVKGANDVYQFYKDKGTQGNALTPMKTLANLPQIASGVILTGANLIASVPAALQTVNFLNNPNKMVYTGLLPKNVSGVEVIGGGKPAISDSVTVSVDSVEQANSVLGELTTSGVELAQRELPKAVDAVVTEFQQNPYGLAGQVLGGALLTKGVGSVLPKKVPNAKVSSVTKSDGGIKVTGGGAVKKSSPVQKTNAEPIVKMASGYEGVKVRLPTKKSDVDGEGMRIRLPTKKSDVGGEGTEIRLPTKKSDVDGEGTEIRLPTKKSDVGGEGMRIRLPTKKSDVGGEGVFVRLPTKKSDFGTVGGIGALGYLSQAEFGEYVTIPRTVKTVTFSSNTGFVDDLVKDYPTKERPSTANIPKEADKVTVSELYSSEYAGRLRDENDNVNKVKYDVIPRRVDANAEVNRLKYDFTYRGKNAEQDETKRRTAVKNKEEYEESNRTRNRVSEEYAYDYPTPTSVRTGRGKRRINLNIDIPRRPAKARKPKRRKKYAKRQIVNPIPWLWDEEPEFTADFPEKVELVSAAELLS